MTNTTNNNDTNSEMRKIVEQANSNANKSQKNVSGTQQNEECNENQEALPIEKGNGNDSNHSSDTAHVTIPKNKVPSVKDICKSSSWDFFMSHCREFDTKDPGLCIRIDRKVKKKLDLAKARLSFNVSEKGMASAIILHFLELTDASFDKQDKPWNGETQHS